jgi:hypothetical protein
VGEIMADLAERGETDHDISMHRLRRLQPSNGKQACDPG